MKRIVTACSILGLIVGTAGAATLNVNDYASIQAAINAAAPGDIVYMPDGTYVVGTTISITKGITLQGQSEAGVILNHATNAGYGFNVAASNVVLEQFTILPPDQNYPIHASGTPNPPAGFDNLTLRHLTIAGAHRRSGFDIHGYSHVVLSHLTSGDAYGGNGLQVTGCVDVDMDNIATADNAWGSIAIYCSQYLLRGSSDVTIDGASLSAGEGWVFSQDEFGFFNTGIDVTGWDYIVRNETHRPDGANYHFFADTAGDAVAFALRFTGFEADSYAWDRHTGEFLVGPGMRVQKAIAMAPAAGVVNILAGTYEEQLDIATGVTLTGAGVGATVILSPVDMPLGFNTGSSTKYAVVYVHDGAAPTISALTVDGAGRGNLNLQFVGIGFWNAGGTVADVHVTGVRDTPFSGAQHGVSIYAYNTTGGPYLVTLADVLVDDIQKNALALLGAGLTVDLDRVTTIGAGPTGVTAQNGIQLGLGAGGTVDDCHVQGFHWTGATWTASGLLVGGAALVTMTGVTVDGAQTSGYFQDASTTPSPSPRTAATKNPGWRKTASPPRPSPWSTAKATCAPHWPTSARRRCSKLHASATTARVRRASATSARRVPPSTNSAASPACWKDWSIWKVKCRWCSLAATPENVHCIRSPKTATTTASSTCRSFLPACRKRWNSMHATWPVRWPTSSTTSG
ncbi:MAG: glycosyl hydrolase family 28-related protein [Vicinamibacterales bacterium]